ncbi:MAG: hypothetical protein ACAI35_27265 [Candidatus Methylacidiphilales bacterium]|nr:hypothetical protein [Candidatus Methylacidiphilales bacterium]
MKNLVLNAALVLGLALTSLNAMAHGDNKIKAGPSGGRVLTKVEPHAEFFVNADKKVEIRFVDDSNKVVAPAAQTATVIVGERSAPTKLAFTKDGNKLISDKALPAGNDLPTVVQIKVTPEAKAVTEKFNLNLEKCPTCKYAEYACECAHGAGDKDKDHDHSDPNHKH